MDKNPNREQRPGRPARSLAWAIGGVLIVILVVVSLQGIIRGTGEAVGIKEAAPGDTNAVSAEGRAAPPADTAARAAASPTAPSEGGPSGEHVQQRLERGTPGR